MNDKALDGFLSAKRQQINEAHAACLGSAQVALTHALQAGRLLNEVKAKLPHGQWSEWVESNVSFSDRTARAYMQLASHDRQIKSARKDQPDLTIDDAIKLLADPREPGTGPLTKAEKSRLAELEEDIDAGMTRIREAAAALEEIKSEELWRKWGFSSWEDFCEQKMHRTAAELEEDFAIAK